MYKIKENLNLEQCINYLNQLHVCVIDYSISCGEVEYLISDLEKSKPIIDLLLENSNKFYENVLYEHNEIEIDLIWSLICDKFDKNIAYLSKYGFRIKE